MIVAKFSGYCTTSAYGLTQWDYGQELAIECAELEIPDDTEINYYQGKLSSIAYLKSNHAMIPDIMLQNPEEIIAYVYVRAAASGETILSIKMTVDSRPQPDNYVLPEYKDYSRLLPKGGESGQTLVKASENDYDTEWATMESNLEPLTDEEIDNICV